MTEPPSLSHPIPVCRPLLPTADRLVPYLQQIDGKRWYSNFGPLNEAFTERLARRAGTPAAQVVTAANATAALTFAMMDIAAASGGRRALMPSWTFVATAQAARVASLEPLFADVDPETWQLTPAIARQAIAGGDVGVVVVVGPFGAPVDIAGWEAFADETGLPVIIDAAASFDVARASRLTTIVSLHATKSLPAGEGAFVICRDDQEAIRLKRRQNFGFYGSRIAEVTALNAKMSEYHAAVGLAALDEWDTRRALFAAAIMRYRARLPANRVRLPVGFGTDWISATMCVSLSKPARQVAESLRQQNIETRSWWAEGCHLHPAFADCPRTALPHTDELARFTLGLPISVDITPEEIDVVAAAVAEALD